MEDNIVKLTNEEINKLYNEMVCENEKGCKHYKRNCAFISPCCNEQFICRLCHDEQKDENEIDYEKAHKLDRTLVKDIVCLECKTRQNISNECINCKIQFGNYYCSKCNLFDNIDKGQYHCDLCGICRVGGKDNFFHCLKCNMCLSIKIKEEHIKNCNSKNYFKDNCAFCQDDIFSSTKPSQSVNCGHVFHTHCLVEYFKQNNYKCPYCFKAMTDVSAMYTFMDHEIDVVQMPDEYKDTMLDILCNECEKKSKCKFHVVGLKCQHCGSYNTRQIKI